MESQRLCAYNQTRECFLGLEVTAADLSYGELGNLLGKLDLKSGEGLWMMPFRGIPETNLLVPLDLIYLDEDCRVLELVESFPTFRATGSSPQAASVLALPVHSIYSSQTQADDQLMLCVAEEMQRRLERLSTSAGGAGAVRSAALLQEMPLRSGGPGVVELEDGFPEEGPKSQRTAATDLNEPGMENIKPSKNWLERWWSSDPRKDMRKAPRAQLPGLTAYYWTGAAATAHAIRDISSTGLYVVTEERWYPGTLILMTLQESGDGQESVERSIAVHSRAVRWGNDGVGLQFVTQDAAAAHKGLDSLANGADRKKLGQFLQRLLNGLG